MGDVGQVEDRHVQQRKVAILCPRLPVVHPDQGGMDPPVRIRQEAGGHRALQYLVAFRSLFDKHATGKEKRIGGGIDQLAVDGGGRAADTTGDVFETAGFQIKIQLAAIREDEFVVSFALEPYMSVGLGVFGFVIVGNLVRCERVVLVVDPDVAGQRIYAAMLFLLPGFEAYGNT